MANTDEYIIKHCDGLTEMPCQDRAVQARACWRAIEYGTVDLTINLTMLTKLLIFMISGKYWTRNLKRNVLLLTTPAARRCYTTLGKIKLIIVNLFQWTSAKAQ